ncbi:MAG TPA: type I-B CRISPR-associated protein Cas7/Cst2/DevR [Planctomycetaceae bacterium]|nr:type I-B CRISPR-associated protein Cas7/Cst2/DevR [Planctomycetaceae bacterium]
MSLHVFANIVTAFGTAANNRAETEGNITTLQKLIWQGQVHSTVSAEAIRFALRQLLAETEEEGTNRIWNEEERVNEWKDHQFKGWNSPDGSTYIDDDLLGYMTAEAAKEEGAAGSANVRRAVLEVTRAVSVTPWPGDVTFNAASPGATPSAQKKGSNPVPYGTELHATRYQFGLALTPQRLRDPSRAAKAIRAVGSLRSVAGNHGRFLFDFSPEAIVVRITDDPAPRLLYCFESDDDGKTVSAPSLVARVRSGDIAPSELIVGGAIASGETGEQLRECGVESISEGVKSAIDAACERINNQLGVAS